MSRFSGGGSKTRVGVKGSMKASKMRSIELSRFGHAVFWYSVHCCATNCSRLGTMLVSRSVTPATCGCIVSFGSGKSVHDLMKFSTPMHVVGSR